MAKRYHGGPKHHSAHLSGHLHEGHYEDHAHKMAMERSDGDMIPSGSGKYANMPDSVVMRPWSEPHDYMPEHLDDTVRGIDHQIGEDESKRDRHMHPKKV